MSNKREFITLLGGAAAWPVAARAQQAVMPVIGFLHSGSPGPYAGRMAAFRRGLSELGFVEGKNVLIEYRWADGYYDRLPAMVADLVGRNVQLIVAAGAVTSGPAAKAATTTIPIIVASAVDPVAAGLVSNLARPDGNITGVTWLSDALGAKQLGLLNEIAPSASVIGVLVNPTSPTAAPYVKEAENIGRALRRQIIIGEARNEHEIEDAFKMFVEKRIDALLVRADPFFTSRSSQIAHLGTRLAIPSVYSSREYAEHGGVMSYGANVRDEYRKVGVYAGRILRGAQPADLPVQQPTKFELVINLKAAKSMGLKIPESFLLLADEVIE